MVLPSLEYAIFVHWQWWALAVARKDSSATQIKNKQDLYQALTNREMFDRVLEQGLDYVLSDKEIFNDTSRFEQL